MASTVDMPHMTWTQFEQTVLPGLRKQPRESTEQYAVAAYDSSEGFQRRVLIVSAKVAEPTVLRAKRARTNRRPMAVIVPSLEAVSLPLLQALTGALTDFIAVRHLFTGARVMGKFDGCVDARNSKAA